MKRFEFVATASEFLVDFLKIRNGPTIISGRRYAGHALDRMQDRGFMPSVIESTIQSNVGIPNKIIGRIQFYDVINNVSVVAENSEVVTVLRGRLN